jgi:hypothetical protein
MLSYCAISPRSSAPWPRRRSTAADAVESDGTVGEEAFDLRLAVHFQAELGEERDGGVQVVDHDGDVIHPLKSHFPPLP